MTRFIYKYLSACFIVKLGEIVLKDGSKVYYVEDLIEELSKVFGLTKKQLKFYIKGWALKQNKEFDFKKFWRTSKPWGGILPIVTQVFARTIAQDLVAVQPLAMPSGMLFYMDFQTQPREERPNNNNGRIYNRDVLDQAMENTRIGELHHPEGSAVSRFMNQWAGLPQNQTIRDNLNQLYRNQLAHLQRPI